MDNKEKKFNELYSNLNKQQKLAVDSVEGPVMVLAGPGTGKTQILTLRIANILRVTQATPDTILALTFTEAGVSAMRERLFNIIGSDAHKVAIATFHGFCNNIINEYAEYFPRIIGGKSVSDIKRIQIFEEIINNNVFEQLKPFGKPYYFLTHMQKAIQTLKREEVDPDEFEVICKKDKERFAQLSDLYHEKGAHKGKMKAMYKEQLKYLERNFELLKVYRDYEGALTDNHLYDYEDMILEVVRALEKNEDLLQILQEQYQYILADEHQDTNNAQNRILELLSSHFDRPNLFLVGDDKQAIYRFQGASVENFMFFKERFKDVLSVTLVANYRSAQIILDTGARVMEHCEQKTLAPANVLKSQPIKQANKLEEKKGTVELAEFTDETREANFIAEDILKQIKLGEATDDIAVLTRTNADLKIIESELAKRGIPSTSFVNTDVLTDTHLASLFAVINSVVNYGDDLYLVKMLHEPYLGIDQIDVYKFTTYASRHRLNMHDLLEKKDDLQKIDLNNTDALLKLGDKLRYWNKLARSYEPLKVLEAIVKESGFLESQLSERGELDVLRSLNKLYSHSAILLSEDKQRTLIDIVRELDTLRKYGISIKTAPQDARGVSLLNVHKAKGLEFNQVYLFNVYDKHWGVVRDGSTFRMYLNLPALSFTGSEDDERRLFYVALTRAKTRVVITFSNTDINGNGRLPSRFITDMGENNLTSLDATSANHALNQHLLAINTPKTRVLPPVQDLDFLRELFFKRGLSVTALNNYLNCPWKFFYNNLLRLPITTNKHLAFGNAMHHTLRDVFNLLAVGSKADVSFALDSFAKHLNNQPVTQDIFDELLKKGNVAIKSYFDAYARSWITNVKTEYRVSGVVIGVNDGAMSRELKLKGDLDKIEIIEKNNVNVIDYKTGKHKSRNDIEGNTKSSDGNYKRQLVFYKLLLGLIKNGEYNMQTGEIDFLEPDAKTGKQRKEKFEITDTDVDELLKLIQTTVSQIATFSFWDARCDNKECEYCLMRERVNGMNIRD